MCIRRGVELPQQSTWLRRPESFHCLGFTVRLNNQEPHRSTNFVFFASSKTQRVAIVNSYPQKHVIIHQEMINVRQCQTNQSQDIESCTEAGRAEQAKGNAALTPSCQPNLFLHHCFSHWWGGSLNCFQSYSSVWIAHHMPSLTVPFCVYISNKLIHVLIMLHKALSYPHFCTVFSCVMFPVRFYILPLKLYLSLPQGN